MSRRQESVAPGPPSGALFHHGAFGAGAARDLDVTLIDEMLALTPEQRLRHNDRVIRTIESLRRGLSGDRPDTPPR